MATFQVPILFIIFSKIEETKKVFDAIRSQKPARLFVAADGSRNNEEEERCQYIRQWVLNHIDWPCDVKTMFNGHNVGCGKGPVEAINWFFSHVDEGIILEDDCLPNKTFFRFSADLLDHYRNDNRISIISGNNFQLVQPMKLDSDYYYSVFPSSNGWATWKRSWDGYDFHISNWRAVNKGKLAAFLFTDKAYSQWWINFFGWLYKNQPTDMWDYQFHYHCMVRNQLAVIPKANLVKNIGYGLYATHSQDPNSYFANVPTHEFVFPLRHPKEFCRNYEADLFIQGKLFGRIENVSLAKKVKRLIKRVIYLQF